jgi:pantoate--beta-alanine ligase
MSMLVIEQIESLQQQVRAWKAAGERVGFVPTMGNLHAGHLSLVDRLKPHCDRLVVSVFVNPLQFGPNEDFERYPRTFAADRAALEAAGVHAMFHPNVDAMYPAWPQATRVLAAPELAARWEGASRPGHFDGVATVVSKLFNIVQPDAAAFGQKDFQQLRIIETMVAELNYPIEIVRVPIAREADGLAMSSRNQYLDAQQRIIAPQLYATLTWAAEQLRAGLAPQIVQEQAQTRLLKAGFDQVDYFALCDQATLAPTQGVDNAILLAAARLGSTRLLDNLLL